jgi:hypothetical protein
VQWNNRCLFWYAHKTHKYTVWAERDVFFLLTGNGKCRIGVFSRHSDYAVVIFTCVTLLYIQMHFIIQLYPPLSSSNKCYVKSKFRHRTADESPGVEYRCSCTLSLTSVLERGEFLTPRPGFLCYRKREREGGVVPRECLDACGKSRPTGIFYSLVLCLYFIRTCSFA